PLSPVLDDQRLRNDITVQREGGSSARLVDEESIQTEGQYDDSLTLNVWRDDQLIDLAGWELHLGTWQGMRVPQVTIDLLTARPEVRDAWLTIDIGYRLTIG